MSTGTMAAFVAGVLVPLIVTLLGKEAVGNWLLAGTHREASALTTLMEVTKESIEGWRKADGANRQLAEAVRGIQTEQKYYYQDLRNKATEREARMLRVEDLLTTLIALLTDQKK